MVINMDEVKICPRCNVLPNFYEKRTKIGFHLCSINCPNLGCPYYYPVVATSFSKKKARKNAVLAWNTRIEKKYDNLLY